MFQLRLRGDRPLAAGDPQVGYYCGLDHLTVAVLAGYGLSRHQVQQWLDGDKISS